MITQLFNYFFRALLEAERKKLNVERQFKQTQTEVTKCNREITSLQSTNSALKQEIEMLKANLNSQRDSFINSVKKVKEHDFSSPSYKRIILESPAPSTSGVSPTVVCLKISFSLV